MSQAIFGAGCFWGVEAAFRRVKGVTETAVGYMGGTVPNPTYEQVCTGQTGHAEVVQLNFDPSIVSYEKLLEVFFVIHDPTQVNRQGLDIGEQYRSVIFFQGSEQKSAAKKMKEVFQKSGKSRQPIATEIACVPEFYRAEEYHQQYFEKQGIDPTCHLPPE